MSTESLSNWLALREAADARARSSVLVDTVARHLPAARPLRVVDLGTGTGANIRYLSSRLPGPQEWLAVDRDSGLLKQLPPGVNRRCMELGTLDSSIFAGQHLVAASALLDLVSRPWLQFLARRCRDVGAAALFALTYDGRSSCQPPEDEDALVGELFNTHQRRNDKGFGIAAGPDAVAMAVDAFEAAGYSVARERTDWNLAPDEAAMQRALIAGWAQAAIEVDRSQSRTIRNWLARRLAHVDEGRSRLHVGHEDIAAWLR